MIPTCPYYINLWNTKSWNVVYRVVHTLGIITIRNSSCGKVMFSQASVILSTEGRRIPSGQTPPAGQTSLRQTPPSRHPPPRDSHCSGRYASYWNAFLYWQHLRKVPECHLISLIQGALVIVHSMYDTWLTLKILPYKISNFLQSSSYRGLIKAIKRNMPMKQIDFHNLVQWKFSRFGDVLNRGANAW